MPAAASLGSDRCGQDEGQVENERSALHERAPFVHDRAREVMSLCLVEVGENCAERGARDVLPEEVMGCGESEGLFAGGDGNVGEAGPVE